MHVKGNGNGVRFHFAHEAHKYIEKTENCIGGRAIRRVERAHTVKASVCNAVAVYDHQLHKVHPFRRFASA